ncbi:MULTISPECIES: phage tail tape measure protein [unclassified Nodularia (in: cyanobacteria)]|uniref:phage tail tape measure protein n=1 Tax=unclassified Nodularia (in: cyanobacteria) TaxID=2656917 RepID=UPI0018815AFB|nr:MULTISPECIES: phage tail tape measure protein [unclassified Nodularia (in: cyanobacteria)]MBE9200435.1 phage tail tape measure protein [Nodularia sp. LEGE 06071]MCC2694760.1 phage tail tape measure protein [Nodularia sp. LEGE 04288]
MKVAVQPEDLQVLTRTLQEKLLAEVPSGEVFQIKCAVKNKELMVLTQHPVGVTVDTEYLFFVLSEALHSSPTDREQRVQCFIRIFGEELPYARRSLMIKQKKEMRRAIPLSSSLTYTPSIIENEPEAAFDPFIDTPDLLTTQSHRPVKSLLIGITLVGICVFGSGVYLVTRPCVMSECKELQTAQQLNGEFRQRMRDANSANQLIAAQQQLITASTDLSIIPHWSPRYQQAQELKARLSMQSDEINQVVMALQAGDMAETKTQRTANSLEELQDIQYSWRGAIAPLEAVSSSSELYELVQPRLSKYRVSLQAVNQQLLAQEQWLKKLNDAKAVVIVAQEREANAKSLNDWQKSQTTWQVVINALNIIPPTSPAYPEAQKLLLEYKPRLARTRDRATTEQLAARSYQQAISTANQAQTYEQKNQWHVAVTYWSQALQNAQQTSQDSVYYNQSQSLIEPYSTALKQAQAKLQVNINLQQVRNDLEQTCSREIRICTFTINNTGIAVSLTPEYEQMLQTTLSEADLQTPNYWQILQETLGVIGNHVNLPVFIYDTQGQGLYTHLPQGS